MIRGFLLLVVLPLLVACAPIADQAGNMPDAGVEPSTPIAYEALAFAGDGDTFLAHIQSIIAARGAPDRSKALLRNPNRLRSPSADKRRRITSSLGKASRGWDDSPVT